MGKYSSFKRPSLGSKFVKISLFLIPIFSILVFNYFSTDSVEANSSCRYTPYTTISATATSKDKALEMRCIKLEDGSKDIYTLTYKFKVTGISNAASK